jgi:lysophospholipase L1-like esterase
MTTTETYQWPGTYMETAFDGPEVTVRLNDSANIMNVLIDHQVKETLNRPGDIVKTYKDLGAGQHVIRLERLTETQGATGTFSGFFAPNNGPVLAVRPRTKQIEFIGDSYTVGYGNTAGKRTCTPDELWASTDTQQAFGPLTAKHYNADYQINAFSGRGIVRNYDGFAGDPLPALYPYALYDGKTAYNDPDWQPQIIVIALGTNDFSTPVHAGEKWKTQAELVADYEASYVTFVKSLRAKNPNAAVLLISYDPATSPQISTVRNRLKADGDNQVDFLEITGFTKNACDYHPDTDDDRKISATLINWFDARPDLWQGK